MSGRRTVDDDVERTAIEESEDFRAGQPQALERHQLNTFTPFFKDRATVERVSLGFTEITAANIQQAPQRMMGSLAALNPIRKFAGIAAPTLVVHSELDPSRPSGAGSWPPPSPMPTSPSSRGAATFR